VTTKTRAYVAWTIVCLVWGTTYLAIRISIETIPPLLMAAFRWILAGSLLIGILRSRGEGLPTVRSWPALAALGVLLVGLGNGAVVWAEQTVPSGLTAVLVATAPFWLVGIDAFRADSDFITPRRVLGLVTGFTGIVWLVWPAIQVGGGRPFVYGVIATQLACVGWGIGSTYARRRDHEENVLMTAAFEMLFGGLALLVAGSVLDEWSALSFDVRTIAALIYLVLVGSIAGFSAYVYALKHLPVAFVSLYAYVNPVIAVLLGALILGEPLSARIGIAAGVVLLGIGLVKQPDKKLPAREQSGLPD
jgi:drug/metabolite transporter (DMT)-like permease